MGEPTLFFQYKGLRFEMVGNRVKRNIPSELNFRVKSSMGKWNTSRAVILEILLILPKPKSAGHLARSSSSDEISQPHIDQAGSEKSSDQHWNKTSKLPDLVVLWDGVRTCQHKEIKAQTWNSEFSNKWKHYSLEQVAHRHCFLLLSHMGGNNRNLRLTSNSL